MNNLKFLNIQQINFFNAVNSLDFKHRVLKRSKLMGMDGAFYFTIGEFQSELNNTSFDDLTEDQQEDFLDALINEHPELEF